MEESGLINTYNGIYLLVLPRTWSLIGVLGSEYCSLLCGDEPPIPSLRYGFECLIFSYAILLLEIVLLRTWNLFMQYIYI